MPDWKEIELALGEHRLLAWLVTWQVHGVLLLVPALFAAGARRWSATARERWLGFALLAPLVTATLQLWLGAAVALPLAAGQTAAPAGGDPGLAALAPPAALPSRSWPGIVVAIVAGLALCSLAMAGIERRRTTRRLADRVPLADATLSAILDHLRRRQGMRRRVRLSSSAAIRTPIAFGVWRPEVCLPLEILPRLGRRELRAAVAHELAHLKARDPLWLGLVDLVPRLFPWQPLFWLARRRILHLAELRCDAVAARDCGGTVVARCLVEVASLVAGQRRVALASMAVHRSALRERIDRLLAPLPRAARRRGPPALWMLAALAVSAVALPGTPRPLASPATAGSGRAAVLLGELAHLDAACAELATGFSSLQQDLARRRLDVAGLAELREITRLWNRLDEQRIALRTRIVEACEALELESDDAQPNPDRR